MPNIHQFARSLLLAAMIAAAPLASAVPYSFSYGGTVSGETPGFLQANTILSEFPLGTTASFNLSFNTPYDLGTAAASTVGAGPFDFGAAAGSVTLGGRTWSLNNARIFSFSFNPGPDTINWYNIQFDGTGPTIAPSGGSAPGEFFALFLTITPQLQLLSGASPLVGFAYNFSSDFGTATYFGYANLSGTLRAGTTSVPEPSTFGLLGLGLLSLLGFVVRRRQLKSR